MIEAPKPPSQKPGYTPKSRLAIILLFVCQIIVGRVMMQSFVIVACIQVTVAKTTVDVGQQLHLVAYVVFAPLVQFFQHLLGLLQTVLVMAVGLRCNTTVSSEQRNTYKNTATQRAAATRRNFCVSMLKPTGNNQKFISGVYCPFCTFSSFSSPPFLPFPSFSPTSKCPLIFS